MIVGVSKTCNAQYTWDSSICIFLFNKTTPQVFVTYPTGALYVHTLWLYKHQHYNPVRSACQRWRFQCRCRFVPSVPDTHAPCLLKLCIVPSSGIVRWRVFPEFGGNCRWTVVPPQSFWIALHVIISINQKLVYHSIHTEYRLLSEERNPIRKNWQQCPSRGLRGTLPAPLDVSNWQSRNLQLRIKT